MNAKRSLRAGSVVTLLLALGHTLGNPWTPEDSPAALAVVAAMRNYHFDATGFERSYFDFYVGFGWMLSVYLVGHAVLYWQIASFVEVARSKLRAIVGILTIESIGVVILSLKFLFWIAVIMNACIALLLAVSFYCVCSPAGLIRGRS